MNLRFWRKETVAKKKTEPKPDPIVNATTPDFLPASQNPGGIPVVDSNGAEIPANRDEIPAPDPGRIQVEDSE
jgi:hypothetical protein